MEHDVHIYTDGAAKGNPGNGGYGVVMEKECMGCTFIGQL